MRASSASIAAGAGRFALGRTSLPRRCSLPTGLEFLLAFGDLCFECGEALLAIAQLAPYALEPGSRLGALPREFGQLRTLCLDRSADRLELAFALVQSGAALGLGGGCTREELPLAIFERRLLAFELCVDLGESCALLRDRCGLAGHPLLALDEAPFGCCGNLGLLRRRALQLQLTLVELAPARVEVLAALRDKARLRLEATQRILSLDKPPLARGKRGLTLCDTRRLGLRALGELREHLLTIDECRLPADEAFLAGADVVRRPFESRTGLRTVLSSRRKLSAFLLEVRDTRSDLALASRHFVLARRELLGSLVDRALRGLDRGLVRSDSLLARNELTQLLRDDRCGRRLLFCEFAQFLLAFRDLVLASLERRGGGSNARATFLALARGDGAGLLAQVVLAANEIGERGARALEVVEFVLERLHLRQQRLGHGARMLLRASRHHQPRRRQGSDTRTCPGV